jgi:DNA polymerase (family 10)
MPIDKKVLVAQLKESARLLEVLGEDPFRARAFDNAARQLDTFGGDVARLLTEDRLTEVPGIGKGLAAELAALKTRDTLPLLDELHERVPAGVRSLFRVSGLGAKKIAALWRSGITDLPALVEAARDGRVAALKGFGAKSAQALLEAAEFALEASRYLRLDQAEVLAEAVVARLHEALPQARFEVAGELRRACEVIAGLELVAADADATEVQAVLGETRSHVKDDRVQAELDGYPLTVHLCRANAFGTTLARATGNEAFWGWLEQRAGDRGVALQGQAYEDEASLFTALSLPFIPPERREEAEPETVPDLVTRADIRGLVHAHTRASDGAASLREMVAAAQARGYRYLAMADHSQSSQVANGLSPERVLAQAEEVAQLRRELAAAGSDFGLLHGIEVDIRTDGSLDYDDEILARLDYVIVSVHQNFSLSLAQQTERIVRAVRHPRASILAHPTGRLLLQRPGYALDLEAVIEACAESGTVIELNANPRRLDLDWRWVKRAKAQGCRFAINPDAHAPSGYDDLRYGVAQARKGGLTTADVVNTAPNAEAFLSRLKR